MGGDSIGKRARFNVRGRLSAFGKRHSLQDPGYKWIRFGLQRSCLGFHVPELDRSY